MPGLFTVGRAPDGDRPGLALERHEEGVDRDVVQAGQFRFQAAAVRASRVAEDGDAPLAIEPGNYLLVIDRDLAEVEVPTLIVMGEELWTFYSLEDRGDPPEWLRMAP